MRPDTRVLCTGAAYAIRRFCEGAGRPFAIRAYTESEFRHALGDMLPKLSGHHFHDISDPAWFGLWDFKVLLLEKPTDRKSTRLNSSHGYISYAVFCLKKKKNNEQKSHIVVRERCTDGDQN